MTPAIAYVLCLLVVALALFAWDVLPVDVTALIVLLLLTVPGTLDPTEALAGFGSDTIITLVALFVVTEGVKRTGVVERLGMRLASLARERSTAMTSMLLVAVTAISGFLSNTVTTAAMLPLMMGHARRAQIPLPKVLMPLAFASILSGGVTLISTSTNLVVSGELHGLAQLGFFEMAPVGLWITALGMLYLIFVAPRLIPDRGDKDVVERYDLRKYFTEVLITPKSALAGKTLGESRLGEAIDLLVVGIRRGSEKILALRSSTVLNEGDILLVEGDAEDVLAVKDAAGIEIKPDFKLASPDLVSEHVRMVEAMVLPRSELIGGTLRETRFAQRTGLTVLGIHVPPSRRRLYGRLPLSRRRAPGLHGRSPLSRHRMEAGDLLLLQGKVEDLARVNTDDLLVLGDKSAHHPRSTKAPIATAVFVGTIVLGASRVLPLPIALLLGVPVLILTRCLTTEESVDWRLMVLIGAMMAFGTAMAKTGAAEWVADVIVRYISPLGSFAMLVAFFLLTVILTQPMSNQAAALVVLPVAIQAARSLGVEERPLVMSVAIAASCSFLTPLEPSCLLVYGPGRYRFFDFVRVGGLLTLIVFVVSILLIPLYWPM